MLLVGIKLLADTSGVEGPDSSGKGAYSMCCCTTFLGVLLASTAQTTGATRPL